MIGQQQAWGGISAVLGLAESPSSGAGLPVIMEALIGVRGALRAGLPAVTRV